MARGYGRPITLCAACAAANPQAMGKSCYIRLARGISPDRVVAMRGQGIRVREIAQTLGISPRRVYQILNPSKKLRIRPTSSLNPETQWEGE